MTGAARIRAIASCALAVACTSRAPEPHDEAGTPVHEAGEGAGHDAAFDATLPPVDAGDAMPSATALVRLANLSPDAPGLDFCVSLHGAALFVGPVLAGALGKGPLGTVRVVDAGIPTDAAPVLPKDAGAADVGSADGAIDAGDAAPPDADVEAGRHSDAGHTEGGPPDAAPNDLGTPYPRFSPYVALDPGVYDVRLVAGGAKDCASPVTADTNDLPALGGGTLTTLGAVGDFTDVGTDPSLYLTSYRDDTVAPTGEALLRFIDAVPSVVEVTLGSGTLAMTDLTPYAAMTQFGDVGADTDAATFDLDGYLTIPALNDAIWSVVNANGGVTQLVAVDGVNVPAGSIATAVAIGGKSGPDQTVVGILLCIDKMPIVAGEGASCVVLEQAGPAVCPSCP